MQDEFTEVWDQSRAYYAAHLSERDRVRMGVIRSEQDLINYARTLEVKYSAAQVVRGLKRTQTFIAQLKSFTTIINIFVQNSNIAGFVWGPLALILELTTRHQDNLELIGDIFERFERALPRFQEYLKEFASRDLSGRLREALVVYYAELIAHYQDSIKFLRVHPLKNLIFLNRYANRFSVAVSRRLSIIRDKTAWVEEEVEWAKYRTQQQQRQTVLQLLQAHASNPMTSRLPFRNFPYSGNNRFKYREELLDRLKTHLQPTTTPTTLRTASLHGLGGVGKTQIALEFAYRHADDYDAIFWLKAETSVKLRESTCICSRALQQESQPGPQQDAALVSAFQRWLVTATTADPDPRPARWLIIFDNLDRAEVMQEFWPGSGHGSVIITTRNPELRRSFAQEHIEVPLFTKAESLDFMMDINPYADRENHEELMVTGDVATRLGHLPLTLNHIGTFVRTTASSYRNFIRRCDDFDTNLLFEYDEPGPSYQTPVRSTWTKVLMDMDASAKTLVELLVLFDPDDIPIELLECCDGAAKMYNGPSSEFPNLDDCTRAIFPGRLSTDKAIAVLLQGSLINRSPEGDRLSCHRIVKEAIMWSVDKDMFAVNFDWAVFSLNGCFPKTPHASPLLEDWDKCALFHPHLSALVEIYKRFSYILRPPILLCEVIRRCSWYLLERGSFKAATGMVNEGLQILEAAVTEDNHPGYYANYMCRLISEMYTTLGSIEYELNLPDHGRSYFEKAHAQRSKLLEEGTSVEAYDVETMSFMRSNISLTYLSDHSAAQSIESFHHLINDFDNRNLESVFAANLSLAYKIDGQLEESLRWCQRAFGLTREVYGQDSLSMARVLFNMGNTYLSMKQDDQALESFEACLRIRRQKSPTHAYTGFTCHKIGVLMRARGDLLRAIELFRFAANILQDCESHTGATARSKFALAGCLKETGSFDEAETVMGEVRDSLARIGHAVDAGELNEEFLEQFTLYCHR